MDPIALLSWSFLLFIIYLSKFCSFRPSVYPFHTKSAEKVAAASQRDLLSHQRRLEEEAGAADRDLKLALYFSACEEAAEKMRSASSLRAHGKDFKAAGNAFASALYVTMYTNTMLSVKDPPLGDLRSSKRICVQICTIKTPK